MSNTVYLVTGSARGIGFGIVEKLVHRPDTVVYAGVRSLDRIGDNLSNLAKEKDNLKIVKIASAEKNDIENVIDQISKEQGKIDVVIANAGIGGATPGIKNLTYEELQKFVVTNSYGPLELFQYTLPLLQKSTNPRYLAITSALGSTGKYIPVSSTAYGASKALLNWLIKAANAEHKADGIIAFVAHPGLVATDMTKTSAAKYAKLGIQLISVDESASGLVKLVDDADATYGGEFYNYDGSKTEY